MAGDLVRSLRAPHVELDETGRRQVLAALDEFTRLMIGRMVVMGEALARLLPPPGR
jgi:type IV secretory pathway TraG/TraD family ATPase VirD4